MLTESDLKPISPKPSTASISAEHVASGPLIPKPLRVTIFSPDEWESFTEEWASSLKDSYLRVARLGGAGDMGLDVIGFTTDQGWEGEWDNYQCKRYDHPLRKSDIWVEIGKLVYYTFKKEYSIPRKYYFVASKGISTTLQKLIATPLKLKAEAKDNWEGYCKDNGITSTASISLEGELLEWFDNFDFSIFSSKSIVEMIAEHAKTPFHSVRFGGGLPSRPAVEPPPDKHRAEESRYIQQIFEAYGNHLGCSIKEASELSSCAKPQLKDDFLRQRQRFYHAESLRNFARDTVEEGTFEKLQEEIYQAVIDICVSDHKDGLTRMRTAITHASAISTTANPLKSVVEVADQQGICHQLANDDRLTWVPEEGEVGDGKSI